ncbi:hypothetical protein HYH03_017428 [Edaphochlamys debaryana]|uniref:Carboxypeptidase n=1 Tax=Edaphochlamys debaryana TaxID=47281 RepID=A0A835XMJ4_9CHLO|nr:hypothetical protein HYH03_017428 [Edaphochlamys debaryana]|eukprot:KAG2483710.1 hypothetical protein HYH03_017428 [Edaphochlamys debaryana]
MRTAVVLLALLGVAQAARMQDGAGRGSIAKRKHANDENLTPEAAADLILTVPGYENDQLTSRHFGGYVTVDEAHERRLFYYFVESERDPANDPVVLWLNGGPGCSSFDGFVFEQGPFLFRLQRGGAEGRGRWVSLEPNPYAWSKVANMIFLDSPAGVGMSYSAHPSDYSVDDERTARDADAFLRGWFDRFPQYGGNQFFVSGESYAGIYVPNLVAHVLSGNERGEEPRINIVGYLVGNGCTDERYDGNAHPPFAAGKSLLPAAGFRALERACGGEYWNGTGECRKLWEDMARDLSALNVYDTLEDCYHDGPPSASSASGPGRRHRRGRRALLHASSASGPVLGGEGGALLASASSASDASASEASASEASASASASAAAAAPRSPLLSAEALAGAGLLGSWPLAGGVPRQGEEVLNWAHVGRRLGLLGLTPPCTDSTAADLWLNDPMVRDAIHAAPKSAIGPWTLCSDKISYTRTHGSMIPVHVSNTKTYGLRALIYSGDHDMAVPHTGSEAWTSELGYPVKSAWAPWFVADGQVAGYRVEYGHGLTYATVKGAGHMVPETNPRESLAMFERFLADKPL